MPLIRQIISTAERRTGVAMDYLRMIAKHSRSAFWKFMAFMPLASYRKTLPRDLWHVARISATQMEDCGACVQITVNLALAQGVSPELVSAVVKQNKATLPPEILQVIDLVRSSVAGDELQATPLREAFVVRHGEAALVELALAVASARVFPTTKKVLGLAKSCSLVQVTLPAGKVAS